MLKFVFLALIGSYLALVLLIYTFQRTLMYAPSREVLPVPTEAGVPELQSVEHKTSDGLTLTSWYSNSSPKTGKTIVYFHGNAGDIADRAFKARQFLDAGYGVFLLGYRGFAANKGTPTEEGLYRDARSALSFLKSQGVAPVDIVLYGESLGGAIAVQMALELASERQGAESEPVRGVVLESTFTSMGSIAAVHYPWLPAGYLVKDKYDSIRKIDLIRSPLYIMHGGRDRTVPQAHGKRLFALAREPKEANWISGAHHNDVYEHGAGKRLIDWLNTL